MTTCHCHWWRPCPGPTTHRSAQQWRKGLRLEPSSWFFLFFLFYYTNTDIELQLHRLVCRPSSTTTTMHSIQRQQKGSRRVCISSLGMFFFFPYLLSLIYDYIDCVHHCDYPGHHHRPPPPHTQHRKRLPWCISPKHRR
jgi:hypothetical protein